MFDVRRALKLKGNCMECLACQWPWEGLRVLSGDSSAFASIQSAAHTVNAIDVGDAESVIPASMYIH